MKIDHFLFHPIHVKNSNITRREWLNHFIVFNETHLIEILKEYFYYYNKFQTHLGLDKDTPDKRPIESYGEINSIPILNGLHNIYFREAI